MSSLLAGINHVALVTDDLDRFIEFYVGVFDADVTLLMDEGAIRHALVEVGNGAALHPFEIPDNPHGAGSPETFGRGHIDHIALNVAHEANFEELRRRLVERGATDGAVTDFGMVRTVWFRDPDGLEGEIATWSHAAPRAFEDRIVEPYEATI